MLRLPRLAHASLRAPKPGCIACLWRAPCMNPRLQLHTRLDAMAQHEPNQITTAFMTTASFGSCDYLSSCQIRVIYS
ncbi:hypothetical protein VFPPC_17823 [Pochonia chlamydosporia 170]|uniref:Uncharacterized protein n=1 Tax=Pochonia chlamydosporia 170 TaxID=1380566 RepID=A0A219ARP1_METCM|nr:hypothetical protein VFPPC_17823 [Pochonia chlamydosporia 170]OWT42984.1 hypothetical protein VFPPC_17823 [Pochonia chlamydosporia 170]